MLGFWNLNGLVLEIWDFTVKLLLNEKQKPKDNDLHKGLP